MKHIEMLTADEKEEGEGAEEVMGGERRMANKFWGEENVEKQRGGGMVGTGKNTCTQSKENENWQL